MCLDIYVYTWRCLLLGCYSHYLLWIALSSHHRHQSYRTPGLSGWSVTHGSSECGTLHQYSSLLRPVKMKWIGSAETSWQSILKLSLYGDGILSMNPRNTFKSCASSLVDLDSRYVLVGNRLYPLYKSGNYIRTPLGIPVLIVKNEDWVPGAPYIKNPAMAYFINISAPRCQTNCTYWGKLICGLWTSTLMCPRGGKN